MDVVCAVPTAIRGTKFESQSTMQKASDDFLMAYGPLFSVTTKHVADILYSRSSGIYRAGYLVLISDILRSILGINLLARIMARK